MHHNKKNKFNSIQRGSIALGLLLGLLLCEPSFKDKFTFAITYVNQPAISSNPVQPAYIAIKNTAVPSIPLKTRAPEPSSLFFILAGIGGIIARFARKSFEQFKRASDVFLAILGLFIASPLLIIAAALIKVTSKGPITYKQRRVGKNGRIFMIRKLRTMYRNAEKSTGAVWAKKNDRRVTLVGKILRKTHIDEIPQLLNVLKGEMSIVGPRPERPEMVRDFRQLVLDYEKRLQVKPGITGLAQVWHKYDETIDDVKKKIKYDVLYIKKMCLLVDLRIMANTFVVVLTGKGAR